MEIPTGSAVDGALIGAEARIGSLHAADSRGSVPVTVAVFVVGLACGAIVWDGVPSVPPRHGRMRFAVDVVGSAIADVPA